jgi:hypothetical protein
MDEVANEVNPFEGSPHDFDQSLKRIFKKPYEDDASATWIGEHLDDKKDGRLAVL